MVSTRTVFKSDFIAPKLDSLPEKSKMTQGISDLMKSNEIR